MRDNIIGLILEELEQILGGESKITIETIEKEENEAYKEILTALLYLNEDLEYSNRKKEEMVIQLMESKKQCEKGSKAKADFLSMMSHEMRTPLNAIIGMSHIMLNENPRPDQMGNLTTLKFAGENLLVLINDILDLNKIEEGKIKIEKTRFSLLQTLDGVIKTLKLKADEKGIKLIFNKSEDLPKTLIGDPTRLIQVITNLVGNAIKFTNKGYVLLDVTTNNKNENDILIEFEIEDSGIGIPKEKQELIFESFMQADSNTTRKYGGSGLGLRITKQLVELQNGNIVVESELGKGSTFRISLPFEIPIYSDTNENLIEHQNELYCLGGIKTLIVEDIEVNRIIADKFLTSWGAITDFAENGKIAVEKVEEQDYDLILMDLQMPVMDGYEATRKIKELDKYKANKIPILALTASAMTDIRDKVQDYGMDDFISKPINPNELNNKVAKHVSKKNKLLKEGNILKNNDNIDDQIVDFKYYTDLARGNNEFLNKLYEQTIIILEEFKVNYSLFFDENNILNLRSTIHKAKSSIVNVNNLIETTSEGKELLLQNENNNTIRKSHLKTIHNLVDVAIEAFNRKVLTLKLGCAN